MAAGVNFVGGGGGGGGFVGLFDSLQCLLASLFAILAFVGFLVCRVFVC